jgi:hypothetical protein
LRHGARARRGALALATLVLSALSLAAPARACELATAPSTRWTIERSSATAWLRDPCGQRLVALGVDVVDAGASGADLDRPHYDWRRFAPSEAAWADATRARLEGWGFNSVGAWSLPPATLRMPTVINLELGRLARFHWFDPFDPATARRMASEARRLTAPYRRSPYRIGYFSDNEVGWWGGALFLFFSQKPAGNYTKQHWVALLRRLYDNDWQRFAADFVPPPGVASWAALLQTTEPTHLRPGGAGPRAIAAWTHEVAAHYYALAASSIRKADPGALFLGDRLPIYYDPAAVAAEAPRVDAISVNYNLDSPEGWIAPYFFNGLAQASGDKPVFVSEWFYAAGENRSGNRNNGHLMTVATQAERAQGAGAAEAAFASLPQLLGLDWFQYYDYPQGGRADREDYDFGLVDIENRPYRRLVAALAAANRAFPARHAAARGLPRASLRDFAVPEAAIDPAHRSLADWPKPASLLPPLHAPRGPAFGEAYLAWTAGGLALAHIGQDYYDPELLAYDGAYPESEAYQLEFDVDAGAGPRRFRLSLVPWAKDAAAHTMGVRLCVLGSAGCAPVPGGEALYFGADQPRVVAAALVPWAALGLAGPPPGRRLKIDVAVTAWDRARWMSLSGRPPGSDPAHWVELRLARAHR